MKFKKSLLLVLILVLTVSLSACGGSNGQGADGDETISINIASAASGGAWYNIAGALSELIKNNIENSVTANTPGAGISNVFSVGNNEAQIAIGFPDDVMNAKNGIEDFEGHKITNIRGIAAMYPGVLHIAARTDSGINSVEDLKGKTICTLPKGNAAEKMTRVVLDAYGLTYDDMEKVNFIGFTDAADAIKDGHADALFAMSTFPYPALQDLATSRGIKLIPLSDEAYEKIYNVNPAYYQVTIPGGTYKGSDEDTVVLGTTTIFFTNEEMPEDLVYDITKLMFDNYDYLVTVNRSLKAMTPDVAWDVGIELHKGAEKYYREIGAIE